jgi:DDB1- and CUL4-associated factor 7
MKDSHANSQKNQTLRPVCLLVSPNLCSAPSLPPSLMYAPSGPSSGVPGSLQPAGGQAQAQARPAPPQAAYTAPDKLPSVPHINTNQQQYSLPTRSNTMSHIPPASHSYSRSSPAGLQDQKYIPFNSAGTTPIAPELPPPKYPQTPQQKYFSSHTPGASGSGVAQSPLVLEQIRPRANSTLHDEHAYELQPTNSNYFAPWAIFAFDWCKYPTLGGSSAGKMAIGSYVEEPHNFVS